MRYYATLSNLGPYAASYFLFVEMQQHTARILKKNKESMHVMNCDADLDLLTPGSRPTFPPPPSDLIAVQEILFDFEAFYSDGSEHNHIPISVPLHWCSPKVRILVDILLAYHSPTFQGIVFVEQRQVAVCLAKILCAIPELEGIIRSASLVGQGVGSDGLAKAMSNSQGNAVELFRKGDINLRSSFNCLRFRNPHWTLRYSYRDFCSGRGP
jgi:endoribonuclease Dicer